MPPPSPERQQALQALSAELSKIAGQNASEADIYQAILQRLAGATEALGGAMWLVAQRSGQEISLRLGAGLHVEAAAGAPETEQRQQALRAATEIILSSQPLVLMPSPPDQGPVTPGVLVNLGPHAIIGAPLRSGDDHLGAVQLWFPAQSDPKKLAELALMIQALMTELGPRLRSRQLRELGAQSQRQQRLLQLASDLTGVLDAETGAKLATAHARELLGINRVSILVREGDRWRVVAISGQESVDKRSRLVTEMLAFVARQAKDQPWVVLAAEEPYFLDSQMQSAALVPLRDGAEGRVLGSLLCESTDAASFGTAGSPGDPRPPALALAQWLASLAGKSLNAALAHQAMPFGKSLAKVGRWQQEVSSTRKRRWVFKTTLLTGLVILAALWPMKVRVEGDCTLLPLKRALVTAEAPGRIEEVLVREGDRLTKNQIIARLDTRRLQSELDTTTQARKRLEAEAERQRAQGKEALARMAMLDAQAQAEMEKRLKMEIELAQLRSPLDGIVMTKDVHLKNGTFLQAGEVMAEIASVDAWDLRMEIAEADISLIEESLDDNTPLPVDYLLYTQSARELHGQLASKQQISPALQAGPEGGRFSITLPKVEIPDSMQPLMRPGLTGRAKIELGRKPAGAVLLRKFTRWLRMRWWI
ncbi:efflux RND transporter periplasmic adaptor subunit [Prosthecobacter dejongeii]|uniref:Multidrug efflux pump subunit AcrA (Membrane-fusion protein)/PAS domain-containing protein n=1 Tax=Prosthecobacter dejongeii TaxID=48465 RepID=A0A7W8DNB8_9BACT|nr:GAF domain-containing protein [Prosthecobacter dejongeii]MBB5035930.1 multidrug efflux pump subunit AcrA (membrane-fusion protein)/PAS domain-containing protein [Prosthecobacter dejongeii]